MLKAVMKRANLGDILTAMGCLSQGLQGKVLSALSRPLACVEKKCCMIHVEWVGAYNCGSLVVHLCLLEDTSASRR